MPKAYLKSKKPVSQEWRQSSLVLGFFLSHQIYMYMYMHLYVWPMNHHIGLFSSLYLSQHTNFKMLPDSVCNRSNFTPSTYLPTVVLLS